MAIEDVRAFLKLGEIGTSGMPKAEHFGEIAKAGFTTVINLALPTSDNALANEGDLVTRAGMTYVHIPVLFDAPKRSDYERFEKLMKAVRGEPVFVHCAANMRVSAFMFLYRLRNGLANRSNAEVDLRRIWEPDDVWREFMNAQLPAGEKPL
ncbi:MAG TPA: protein tyrosine phosphatase family protein [Verrucomicrobiae bacterium]